MVKQLNERFDDDEFKFLLEVKEKQTWREFILEMARNKAQVKKGKL